MRRTAWRGCRRRSPRGCERQRTTGPRCAFARVRAPCTLAPGACAPRCTHSCPAPGPPSSAWLLPLLVAAFFRARRHRRRRLAPPAVREGPGSSISRSARRAPSTACRRRWPGVVLLRGAEVALMRVAARYACLARAVARHVRPAGGRRGANLLPSRLALRSRPRRASRRPLRDHPSPCGRRRRSTSSGASARRARRRLRPIAVFRARVVAPSPSARTPAPRPLPRASSFGSPRPWTRGDTARLFDHDPTLWHLAALAFILAFTARQPGATRGRWRRGSRRRCCSASGRVHSPSPP